MRSPGALAHAGRSASEAWVAGIFGHRDDYGVLIGALPGTLQMCAVNEPIVTLPSGPDALDSISGKVLHLRNSGSST